jgi:hypothetical protein
MQCFDAPLPDCLHRVRVPRTVALARIEFHSSCLKLQACSLTGPTFQFCPRVSPFHLHLPLSFSHRVWLRRGGADHGADGGTGASAGAGLLLPTATTSSVGKGQFCRGGSPQLGNDASIVSFSPCWTAGAGVGVCRRGGRNGGRGRPCPRWKFLQDGGGEAPDIQRYAHHIDMFRSSVSLWAKLSHAMLFLSISFIWKLIRCWEKMLIRSIQHSF